MIKFYLLEFGVSSLDPSLDSVEVLLQPGSEGSEDFELGFHDSFSSFEVVEFSGAVFVVGG